MSENIKPQPGDENWPDPILVTPSGKTKWDNGCLPAGADMFYYCERCGEESDRLPEDYDPRVRMPKKLCEQCIETNSHGPHSTSISG
jgi:hypothetical protein